MSRYDHEHELTYTIVSRLFQMSPITQDGIRDIVDTTREVLKGLENQQVDTKGCDLILNYIVRKNLDNRTRTEFEKSLSDSKHHTVEVLLKYLSTLATALGTSFPNQAKNPKPAGQGNNQKTVSTPAANQQQSSQSSVGGKTPKTIICILCNKNHYNSSCQTWQTLTPQQRKELAVAKKLCLYCLGPSNEKHK